MIIIKKKIKKEKEKERFKCFKKCNVKKYYDKGEFQHFSFNVFDNFRVTKKFDLNT